jgi:hypothetical protein
MDELLKEFNGFFEGYAKIALSNNRIEITIGSRTLIISVLEVIGVQARGAS